MSTDTDTDTQIFDADAPTEHLRAGSAQPSASRARIRWGAIVWGTIVTVVTVSVLVIIGSPERRAAFATWLGALGAGGFVMIGFLMVGGVILILALLAMVRRAQRVG